MTHNEVLNKTIARLEKDGEIFEGLQAKLQFEDSLLDREALECYRLADKLKEIRDGCDKEDQTPSAS